MSYTFQTDGFRSHDDCVVHEISYQRNGISGAGFTVVKFTLTQEWDGEEHETELLGVVFEASKHVAVIDPTNLESHWRGDNFEGGLRAAVADWAEKRFPSLKKGVI